MGNYCEQVIHSRYIPLGLQPMAGQQWPGPPDGRDLAGTVGPVTHGRDI